MIATTHCNTLTSDELNFSNKLYTQIFSKQNRENSHSSISCFGNFYIRMMKGCNYFPKQNRARAFCLDFYKKKINISCPWNAWAWAYMTAN